MAGAGELTNPRYPVVVSRGAQKSIDRLSREFQDRVMRRIHELGVDPYCPNCKQLVNAGGRRRARVGDWRVIYFVAAKTDGFRYVHVESVDHRSDCYRDL